MEEKNDKLDYIKIKNYCLQEIYYKSHHKESEMQQTGRKSITCVKEQRLISRMQKEYL